MSSSRWYSSPPHRSQTPSRVGASNVDVPDLAAAVAGPPAGQAPDHLVVVDHQLEHEVEADTEIGQQLVQRLGLRHGARKAVEQKPVGRVGLGQPVPDHVDRDLVRHELPAVHVPLGLDAQRGTGRDVGAEDVPGRDLGYGQVRGDELGLCALPRTGWAHEDQSHRVTTLRTWRHERACRPNVPATQATIAGTLRSCAA